MVVQVLPRVPLGDVEIGALAFAVAVPVAVALSVVMTVFAAYRNFGFGVMALSLLLAFESILPGVGGLNLGIQLYPADCVTLLLLASSALRTVFMPISRPRLFAWYVFAAAFTSSLLLGLGSFGTAGGVAAREYFYAIAAIAYALSFSGGRESVRSLGTALAWLSIGLLILVAARWLITVLQVDTLLPASGRFASSDASSLRVIPSFEAFVIAQAALVALFYPGLSPALRRFRFATPLLIATIVVLQHRSVWIAFSAGAATRFALPRAGGKAIVQLTAALAMVGALGGAIALSGQGAALSSDIGTAAQRAIALGDTAAARLDTWNFLLTRWSNSGPRGWLIGLPFGESVERYQVNVRGELIRVGFSAHNYYVQTLFNLGLVGLLANVALYGSILIALIRGLKHPSLGEQSAAMLILIVSQLAYYFPYGVNTFQGLVLGVAASLSLTLEGQRRAAGIGSLNASR